jgi:cell division protein FtsZ
MIDDIMKFDLPSSTCPASIKVVGVGGGGGNAVNHMFEHGIKDVDFLLCNTDSQALAASRVPVKIQLGESRTQGRGAGNNPDNGREAAQENIHDVEKVLANNTQMVFITAGMGGGTGTGAAPIIAELARKLNILTVGVVTVPFRFEGPKRIKQALKGIEQLQQYVDSLLIINNEKLREMYGNLSMSDAFAKADDVLAMAVKGIAEIITVHGKVNVDFADVKTVMECSGVSIMGSGVASGENRALNAIEEALSSPLLNNANIKGARNILLNITCGIPEVTMDEVSEITEYILNAVDNAADLIWGYVIDESLGEKLNVTVIATGFEINALPEFSFMKSSKAIQQENSSVHHGTFAKPAENLNRQVLTLGNETRKKNSAQADQPGSTIQFEVRERDDVPGMSNVASSRPLPGDYIPADRTSISHGERGYVDKSPYQEQQYQRQQTINQQNYGDVKQLEDITHLENTSAFSRRMKGAAKPEETNNEVSRFAFSVTKDGVKVSEKNPYIHDNVD